MKKLTLFLSIFLLLIFTTLTKNSTKEIEKKNYTTKENLRILEQKYEMVLLDFNYLSSPEKLMEYQSKYFEDELQEINITDLKKLSILNKDIKIEEFIKFENE